MFFFVSSAAFKLVVKAILKVLLTFQQQVEWHDNLKNRDPSCFILSIYRRGAVLQQRNEFAAA